MLPDYNTIITQNIAKQYIDTTEDQPIYIVYGLNLQTELVEI